VTTPVLVISGENDSAGSHRSSERLAAAIPGAKTVTIKNAGHWSSMEQPEAFTRAVVDFIDSTKD
jgi:pimeloyl-ACP methyl ester carboxylesterase